ncbi:MAG: hypothetical protein PUJ72_04900, partial [Eubacteriales bacterium]|nr:hypothetical protein [Eubacteriales bacterium]
LFVFFLLNLVLTFSGCCVRIQKKTTGKASVSKQYLLGCLFVFFCEPCHHRAATLGAVWLLRLVQVFEEVADDVRGFFFVFGFRLYQIGDELKY